MTTPSREVLAHVLFWPGVTMIAYDLAGHFVCLLARLSAASQHHQWLAHWWNKSSTSIWPSRPEPMAYDAFWSAFFAIALCLMVAGFIMKEGK